MKDKDTVICYKDFPDGEFPYNFYLTDSDTAEMICREHNKSVKEYSVN